MEIKRTQKSQNNLENEQNWKAYLQDFKTYYIKGNEDSIQLA